MNTLLNIYFKLPHDKTFGIVSKAFNRLVAKILKRILDRIVPSYFLETQGQYPTGLNTEKRDKEVIVSFTSFPDRIQDVWIVVECLFRQTYKADKIVLWLSQSQFEGIELPILLLEQQKRGLEIRFVEDDLRSHKKYYYALQNFASSIIVTVDDDVFYHRDVFKTLIEANRKHPNEVISNRAHKIKFNEKERILPYQQWDINYKSPSSSYLYVPTGVGGVLYPPGSLSDKLLNTEAIKELCFHADDLWLKAGSLLMSTKVQITPNYRQEFITVGKSQNSKLVTSNSLNGGNDEQLNRILKYFTLGNLEQYRDKHDK
jgi:hypothetical protein